MFWYEEPRDVAGFFIATRTPLSFGVGGAIASILNPEAHMWPTSYTLPETFSND